MHIGLRQSAAATLALVAVLLAGCGTPGAPQPPSLNLPKPVDDLRLTRKGDTLTLSWTLSTETTDNATLKHPPTVRVCHVVNQTSLSRCENATDVSPKPLPTNGKRVFVEQAISPSEIGDNNYAAYAIELVNDRGRSAGLSNQVLAPLAAIAQPEAPLTAEIADDGVTVKAMVRRDRLAPRNFAGFHELKLLREEKGGSRVSAVVTTSVISYAETHSEEKRDSVYLKDANFEWQKTYVYRVVADQTERLPSGEVATFESADSPIVEVFTKDVFPPLKPSGLQAVFSGGLPGQPNAIDLTWEPNTEKDLAGYNIYRRDDTQPVSAAAKLNTELLKTPAFHDANVQAGHHYLYAVTAIDQRNNESDRSADAAEAVPQQP